MIFSNPSEYAIRALSELVLLAKENGGTDGRRAGYVMLDTLTARAGLPREFLAKIFRELAAKGILLSAKGPGGGFALAREPHEISLINIMEAVDGGHQVEGCVVGLAKCNDAMPCPQHDLFKPIRQRLRAYLQTTTLADTATSLAEKRAMSAKDVRPR